MDGKEALIQNRIDQKQSEITRRRKDIEEGYPYPEWCESEIEKLTREVAEIERFQKEGGTLQLALCRWNMHDEANTVCFLHHSGSSHCSLKPPGCKWSFTNKAITLPKVQETLL